MNYREDIAYYHENGDFRPTSVAILTRPDKLLLVQSAFSDEEEWMLPQEGIEPGEDLYTAFLRGLEEELGVAHTEVSNLELGIHHALKLNNGKSRKRGFTRGKRYYFSTADYHGNGLNLDPEELKEADWFDFPRAIELLAAREDLKAILYMEALSSADIQ